MTIYTSELFLANLIRVLGLSLYGPLAASHRVRLSQFQPGLISGDVELQIHSLLGNEYIKRRFSGRRVPFLSLLASYFRRIRLLQHSAEFDLAIVHCELLPFVPGWIERRLLKIPFVYDFDDAFYLKYRQSPYLCLQPFLGPKIDRMIFAAAAVTAGSHHLASYARQYNESVTILPSVVDTDVLRPACAIPTLRRTTFTVGWIGTPSTAPYLHQLITPLQRLALELPVRFVAVGGPAPIIPGVVVSEVSWTQEHENHLIQQFDVGVMPLPDSPWARGKCAYKLIQYMACAIPVIASPVGANVDAVPSTCGILANSPEQWLVAFRRLANDLELRQRMGAAGREFVVNHYSLRSAIPVLTNVISRAVADIQV